MDGASESSGNEMITLELMIHGRNGLEDIVINDYLVFSKGGFRKIDDFRISTGEKLEPGVSIRFDAEDARELNGKRRRGLCRLRTEPYAGRQYNKIDYYVDPDLVDPQVRAELLGEGQSSKPAATQVSSAQEEPDRIPF
jgi:hypothetical protein